MVGSEDDGDRTLLDVEEVARYLGVAPISVYRWCRTGRLPAVKVGRVWRVRRAALDDLLRREEQPGTLAAQLGAFLRVPDQVLAIAPDVALLHRLDAAFLQAGAAHDGALLKLYGGETDTPAVLREEFARNGLDARGLEAVGRLRLVPAPPLAAGAAAALRALLAEDGPSGRPLWVSVDWAQPVGVDVLLQEQAALAEVVGPRPVVRKLAALEAVVDTWPAGQRRRVQEAQQGLIWLSPSRLWLSRGAPLPSA